MKFLCKLFGHKMYNISWDTTDFTVICIRCEKRWTPRDRAGK